MVLKVGKIFKFLNKKKEIIDNYDASADFYDKRYRVIQEEKYDIIQLEYPFGFFILKLLSKRKSLLIFDSLGIESEFVRVSAKEQRFPKFLYPIVSIITKFYEKMVCKLTDVIINISER